MKLSAEAEYACLAVLDLALRRDKPELIRVADIAERNHIPERFLVQTTFARLVEEANRQNANMFYI